ncbi:glutamine--fructose-6-phosphate transaminase (isomerizing) [Boudabousia marimammalium]|uniref:Glutamine--fructose-6-phosphate aminotransferase [isomerizing] n=1 Tax=Boudabousia marimammalium TaxID=156892 RepID=A0A1Q5PKI5_9ACTO|nr:glutamine--fructose-6-phosphate transaminase (isomerizing) [Boudabousia marimammalium]OKL46724.1 glutamine--fructose-6-phosphate aminotransferase [Boudabousia marimammalium]
MCGIVGAIGVNNPVDFVIAGLYRLEYRGYDSAGVSVLAPSATADVPATLRRVRKVGRVKELEDALPEGFEGVAAIGHTRWATHGPATENNAHPQVSSDERIHLVHNGIIDNAAILRTRLMDEGVRFSSDTDTEVIAQLVRQAFDRGSKTLEEATLAAVDQVTGTYAIAVLDREHPESMVVARQGSPLVLGVGEGTMYVASDVAALVAYTDRVIHLEDGELAVLTPNHLRAFTKETDDVGRTPELIEVTEDDFARSGYEHYMMKEMMEQPQVAEQLIGGHLDERHGTTRLPDLNLSPRELRSFRRVKILGCGSAYYVGQMGAQMIAEIARIPADAEAASEFRYRAPLIEADTLYIVVSQSGETADTAFAVEEIKRKGGYVVGVINAVGSTIARAVDGRVYIHAGAEVAVASTKALTNMAIVFAMIAVEMGRVHDLSLIDGRRLVAGIAALPGKITQIIENRDLLDPLALTLSQASSIYYIGRVRGYPVASEGAQKMKEISYIHAESYQTSELKHGPLALVSPEMPTVAFIPDDELTDRNIAAAEQIMARQGPLVAFTHAGVDLSGLDAQTYVVPKSEPELDPILLTIPMQLLAYKVAVLLGHDVDKPRNLAKSVTVE